MKLLVTGAAGMLGRDVMLAAGNAGHDVIGFGHTELDVSDASHLENLIRALKVDPSPTDYLADIDTGYYVTSYLRAWAFAAQMTTFLREEFGTDWFKRRESGLLLTDLWALGQQPTADELLKDVTGATVELEAVAEHVRAAIPMPA